MRGTILVLGLAATCFGAQASSIVTLGGTPAATPSIIALGEPAAAVSDDKVAAIPKTPERQISPLVIRGGVAGGQSATAAPTPQQPVQAAARPDQAKARTERPATPASQNAQAENAAPNPDNHGPIRAPL